MPKEYHTPLYWSEEERKHLIGTNVHLLINVSNVIASNPSETALPNVSTSGLTDDGEAN